MPWAWTRPSHSYRYRSSLVRGGAKPAARGSATAPTTTSATTASGRAARSERTPATNASHSTATTASAGPGPSQPGGCVTSQTPPTRTATRPADRASAAMSDPGPEGRRHRDAPYHRQHDEQSPAVVQGERRRVVRGTAEAQHERQRDEGHHGADEQRAGQRAAGPGRGQAVHGRPDHGGDRQQHQVMSHEDGGQEPDLAP